MSMGVSLCYCCMFLGAMKEILLEAKELMDNWQKMIFPRNRNGLTDSHHKRKVGWNLDPTFLKGFCDVLLQSLKMGNASRVWKRILFSNAMNAHLRSFCAMIVIITSWEYPIP